MTVGERREVDRGRVKAMVEREEAAYRARTPRSAALDARARQSMPLGVASSFQTYEPYPLFIREGRGSRMWDVDGNEYLDFDMALGVLAAGHSHPAFVEAIQRRAAMGTAFTFPIEEQALVAEELKRRFHADLIRFSNSGTEATMDAIRVARGFTGREKIIKFEGGYHGHHDDVLVSIQPPRSSIGEVDAPISVPTSAGIPRSRIADTVVAPFNMADVTERILERHRGEIAAIIVEPVQFNIGVVPPEPGFLERLRELATEHGAVLIFDEVKTGVVIAYGGATEYYGVQPDLFCLAKSIGGGTPIGAFGGRDEVMRVIEGGAKAPLIESGLSHSSFGGTARVAHMGTMNGSPLVMAAALAVLTKVLTPDVYPRLQAMGDRLTLGSQAIVDEFGLPGYAINVGPKGIVMFAPQRVTGYRDFIGLDDELWASSFWFLANRGILIPPAPDDQWTLSVVHTDAEVDRYLAVFREWAIEVAG